MSNVAPHACPQCGWEAYVGFCVPPRCTNGACIHFDLTLHDERVAEAGRFLQSWDDDTDPMLTLDWFDKRD